MYMQLKALLRADGYERLEAVAVSQSTNIDRLDARDMRRTGN